jgi:MFS transporter, CP family, cyanate transporter
VSQPSAGRWAGRTVALLGILVLALSLRSAVSALSPIVAEISVDIPLSSVGLGFLGALPPVFFALAGIIAPPIARRVGLELTIGLAVVAIVAGHLMRGFAHSYAELALGGSVSLAAMGIANVLLPPAVKRYFPDRIGGITAAYVTMMSVSTALPAFGAAPLAEAYGWRVSLGVWSATAAIAAVPWLLLVLRHRRARANQAPELVEAAPALVGRVWRSRTAWAIAVTFAVTSLNAYAMFAWLPEILVQTVEVSNIEAGALLGLYSFIAVPGSILAPILVTRLRHPGWVIQAGVLFFLVGYGGLLVMPTTATWLWVALIGMGPVLFPVCLTLVNLRTRSQQASAALSGFVQAIGYTLGALGPLLVGVLHDATGGWTVPMLFLVAVAIVGIPFGIILSRPRYIEQDLDPRP